MGLCLLCDGTFPQCANDGVANTHAGDFADDSFARYVVVHRVARWFNAREVDARSDFMLCHGSNLLNGERQAQRAVATRFGNIASPSSSVTDHTARLAVERPGARGAIDWLDGYDEGAEGGAEGELCGHNLGTFGW